MEYLKEETEQFIDKMIQEKISPHMNEVVLDFAFFYENNYQGLHSHKEAALNLITTLNRKYGFGQKVPNVDNLYFEQSPHDDNSYLANTDLMWANSVSPDSFFCRRREQNAHGVYIIYEDEQYNFLFLNPPYSSPVTQREFDSVNAYLFPNRERLIIYKWNDDWTNYFYWGKEWWGAYLWTIYDPPLNRFTVIGASVSD